MLAMEENHKFDRYTDTSQLSTQLPSVARR